MTARGTAYWLRLGLLSTARFLIALAVFGCAELVADDWLGATGIPLWLALVATAIVATTFWLTGPRLQRWVDRLVLGERAGGYEAGRALLQRMATTLPIDQVVPALAETVGRTMHAPRAEVRVLLSAGEPWSQVWPAQAIADGSPVMVGVQHAGTAVGEIEVDLTDTGELGRDRALLNDLARPAGLALSTVRLTVELRRRAGELAGLAEQLESSNRRIVEARRTEISRLSAELQDRVTPHIEQAQKLLDEESPRSPTLPAPRPPLHPEPGATVQTVNGWTRRATKWPMRWNRCGCWPAGSTHRDCPKPASQSPWKAGSNGPASGWICR